MPSYLLRFSVDTSLTKGEDLTLTFETNSATFSFSQKAKDTKSVAVEITIEAKNNRYAQSVASTVIVPPMLDALSYATGTPLLLRECELILKDEAGSATRRAIYVGRRLSPSQVRLSEEAIRETEKILSNGDDLRLPLCWHRYALDRQLALEQFVYHWLAFESLAGDATVVTRCAKCHAEIRHCDEPVTHRGSNKVGAREIFTMANPETRVQDFNTQIWGKARNSVFHGSRYPEPEYLVELNGLSGLLHKATDRRIARSLGLEERDRTHHNYETWYRVFFFVEWTTKDRTAKFARDWPAEHLAQMASEPSPGVAYQQALKNGIGLPDYQTESPDW
jgi:hypothetical protein